VDCSTEFCVKAEKRLKWLAMRGAGPGGAGGGARPTWAGGPPTAVSARVGDETTIDALETLWRQQAAQAAAMEPETEPEPREPAQNSGGGGSGGAILIGLHTCGELTPTMLRLFARSTHAAATAGADGGSDGGSKLAGLLAVGCCYNLLAPAAPTAASSGGGEIVKREDELVCFPLSEAIRIATQQQPSHASAVDGASTCGTEPPLEILRLSRKLCAAAAESTNPAFVARISARQGGASLRARRLARALLQRRLRDHHPEADTLRATIRLSPPSPATTATPGDGGGGGGGDGQEKKGPAQFDGSIYGPEYAKYVHKSLGGLGVPIEERGRSTVEELEEEWRCAWEAEGAGLAMGGEVIRAPSCIFPR
jgi:hypothetical protein